MDATKAFDRVKHAKLFELLIERKTPALALRALLDMYQSQKVSYVWGGKFSRLFRNYLRRWSCLTKDCVHIEDTAVR